MDVYNTYSDDGEEGDDVEAPSAKVEAARGEPALGRGGVRGGGGGHCGWYVVALGPLVEDPVEDAEFETKFREVRCSGRVYRWDGNGVVSRGSW
jgi:hypothetical protein